MQSVRMHGFYTFPITDLHVYRAFDGLCSISPLGKDQASPLLGWTTTQGPQLRSGVLRSVNHGLTFDDELLLQGLFQQSRTFRQVWLEDELGMKWIQKL